MSDFDELYDYLEACPLEVHEEDLGALCVDLCNLIAEAIRPAFRRVNYSRLIVESKIQETIVLFKVTLTLLNKCEIDAKIVVLLHPIDTLRARVVESIPALHKHLVKHFWNFKTRP